MKKLVFIIACLLSLNLYAGTQSGTVQYILVRASDGIISFKLKGGAINNKPACATQGYWQIKDENSNAGKMQYSMLLAAHASGKTVYVIGKNTCLRWGDGEDADTIQIVSP